MIPIKQVSSPLTGKIGSTDPIHWNEWDSILNTHPSCSFFHGSCWAKVLCESYGYTPFYWTRIQDGRLSLLMPLMEVRSYLTGSRGVSLPFTDECSTLVTDPSELTGLVEKAKEFGKERKWKYLEFRGREWSRLSDTSYLEFLGHELDLTHGMDKLKSGFKNSVRRAIRKAECSGVTTTHCHSHEALDSFYKLHCQTRRKHGLPPQPVRFFDSIQRNILARDQGFITTAFFRKRPVASAIFFCFNGRAIFKFGASSERHLNLRANNLVMWSAIKNCIQRSVKSLDFGRTSTEDAGLRRFKLGWGARERKLQYFKYDLSRETFVSGKDRLSGWHNPLFRALPIFACRWLGNALYRHIG